LPRRPVEKITVKWSGDISSEGDQQYDGRQLKAFAGEV